MTARIDNTAPVAVPVAAAGGETWRATNGFGATWANPVEADRAPIVSAHYRLCRVAGGCEDPRTTSVDAVSAISAVQVPAPGEWTLKMWREDAAGNSTEANASAPVTFRYDPEAPKLAIDPLDSADPTLLSSSIEDGLSGVASGGIEISRDGSGTWQALATTTSSGHLRARVDDNALPAGRYLVRARGSDNAGNSGETDKRADGSIAAITLPLRSEARLSAGFRSSKVIRRVVRRKGKRRVVRRRVSTLVSAGRVRRNRTAAVQGTLSTSDGNALPNAAVYAFARRADGSESYIGTANTDVAGRYRISIRPGENQALRLVYLGAPSIRPSTASVTITVPAQSTLRVSDHSLLNGQQIRFRGRLGVAPFGMAGGKLVELQTRVKRGRWETFRALRTDEMGRWAYRYRFTGTRGIKRYLFRIRVRTEGGYPFGTGTSKAVGVKVRGR